MSSFQAGLSAHRAAIAPPTGEGLGLRAPQAITSAQPTTVLPTTVQTSNLTFHTGRLITALSETEAELLHGAFHPDMPKKRLSESPDKNGLYTYIIGAQDYFASTHLSRHFPEQMMVTCTLDSSLGLKHVLISDAHSKNIYCRASFERPVIEANASASEQNASSIAIQSPSRTNLSLCSDQRIQEVIRPQDSSRAPLASHVGTSSQPIDLSQENSVDDALEATGPSHAEASNSAPSEPAPHSQTIFSIKKIKNKPAKPEDIRAHLYKNGVLRSARQIAADLDDLGLGARKNRIQEQIRAAGGIRRPEATAEQLQTHLYRENGVLATSLEEVRASLEEKNAWASDKHIQDALQNARDQQ